MCSSNNNQSYWKRFYSYLSSEGFTKQELANALEDNVIQALCEEFGIYKPFKAFSQVQLEYTNQNERLCLLKVLQYIIINKNDENHKYHEQFVKVLNTIGINNLKSSLIKQFQNLLFPRPQMHWIQNEFGHNSVRQEWVQLNLLQQLTILQILTLIAHWNTFTDTEFVVIFQLFKQHNFGKKQWFHEVLEERHRKPCLEITYLEVGLFAVIVDADNIDMISQFIDSTKGTVESELTKPDPDEEHSLMLIVWMVLTSQCQTYVKLFENKYKYYGMTALKKKVFESTLKMINSSRLSDNSNSAIIVRHRIFHLLNILCNKFDGDGLLCHESGIIPLCADLIRTPTIAEIFWQLHRKDEDIGVVSLWNTALRYFPSNFTALSTLAAALAEAGRDSVKNLLSELKSLPVYTQISNPNAVPIMSVQADDHSNHKEVVHPTHSYWMLFINEIEKALDRRQSHYDINVTLQRVYEGTKVLKGILKAFSFQEEILQDLIVSAKGVVEVLVRFIRSESPPLQLLLECLETCNSLINIFPKEMYEYLSLINTGLLPRLHKRNLNYVEYAEGTSLDHGVVGNCLVTMEQRTGTYSLHATYVQLLSAFYKASNEELIIMEIILPGLVFILREVFPNIRGRRYSSNSEGALLLEKCMTLFISIMTSTSEKPCDEMLKKICLYSFIHTENALELLKIISIGNNRLEMLIKEDTNWISGPAYNYTLTVQRCIAIVMHALNDKHLVAFTKEKTLLEKLIFANNRQINELNVVTNIISYINHAFNKNLSVLCCRLLSRFADGFQVSLFASLDMTAYQVRVMFLNRLEDEYESIELKIAVLDFITICIGKQPEITEAFFIMDQKNVSNTDYIFKCILGLMIDCRRRDRNVVKLLYNPLTASIIGLFHAIWQNNIQILIKTLRKNPAFWEHMMSRLTIQ